MVCRPHRRRVAIFRSRRKAVFGRPPIVHRNHHDIGAAADLAALTVGRHQVADHPATAVKHHSYRPRAIAFWAIDAHCYTAGIRIRDVANGDLRRFRLHRSIHFPTSGDR